MKILIFGAGGIGSVIGGLLARTGHTVSLLGREPHMGAIEKRGLLITGIWGEYRIKALELFRSADEARLKSGPFDLVILTVKSFDTEKAAGEILPLMDTVGPGGSAPLLLSIQNGLGNIEAILNKIRPEQYLAGRAIFGAELVEPGHVNVTVSADDVVVGALPGVTPVMSPHVVAQVLSSAKLPARAVPDILTAIWAKVVYNCALNGICTVRSMPYGDILKSADTQKWMEDVVRECYAVGLRKKIKLEPGDADAYLKLLTGTLIPRTASHFPSMYQDLNKGKRLDIDALNGAICRLGKEFGVATPANQAVVDEVKKLVKTL